MRRRTLLTVLAGLGAAWPEALRAQDAGRVRRIGVLLNLGADDEETKLRIATFKRRLGELGWTEDRNIRFDYRWGLGDVDLHRANAAELLRLEPDAFLVHGSSILRPVLRVTRKVPVVFVSVGDPVAGGFAASLARPGGNATGFASIEYGLAGKWIEILKQISPKMTRVAVLRDPEQVSMGGQLGALQSVAQTLHVEIVPLDVRDYAEMIRALSAFARQPNGALIVTTTALVQINRAPVIALAAKYKLPAIYPYRFFVRDGGLCSYGPDTVTQYRLAAEYVDRILHGAKPAEMPVQNPSKMLFVANLKAAKATGIQFPDDLLARADEVIE